MQGVVVKSEVDEETFQLAKDITQESSLYNHRNDYRR